LEVDGGKLKLEAALKEPEKVKSEWQKKLQKLHDKVASTKAELDKQVEAPKVLKLDYDSTVKGLNARQVQN
jgi:hypothetical protein